MGGGYLVNRVSSFLQFDVSYFLKAGFWLFFGQLGSSLLRLLQVVLLAHFVDKAFFGEFQFVYGVVAVLLLFSLPGLDTSLVRSVAKGFDGSLLVAVRSKVRWGYFGSLVLLVLSLFFWLNDSSLWFVFLLCSFVFPVYGGFGSILAFYRGKEDFRSSALFDILFVFVSTLALIVVLFVSGSLAFIFAGMLVAVSVAYLCVLFFVSKKLSSRVDSGMLSFGKHLTLINFFNYFTPYADRFVIAGLAGFEAVAVYSVAVILTISLTNSGKLFTILLLPKLSRSSSCVFHVKRLFWLVCLGFLLFILCLILVVPFVFPLLFPVDYLGAIFYAQLALLYLVFFLPSCVLYAFLLERKDTKVLFVYNVGLGVLNLLLLGLFVPFFGVLGAVLVKILVGLFGFVFLVFVFFRTIKVKSVVNRS